MNLKILKNTNFLLYTFGQATSLIGDAFLAIALSLYVLNLTGSGAQFAGVLAVGFLPRIILLPVVGVFIDRFDRKKLIIFLDGIRAIFLLGFLVFLRANDEVLTLGYVYCINLFFGVCSTIFNPIMNTMIPFLFEKEDYSDAYAVDDVIMTSVSLIAPVIGAALLGAYGIQLIIFLDAITFLVSTFSEFFIKLKKFDVSKGSVNIIREIKDGFVELYRNKNVFKMTVAFSFLRLLVRPMYLVIVPFILLVLLKSPNIYLGIFNSSLLAASLTGPFFIGFFKARFSETGALKFLLKARVLVYSAFLLLGMGSIIVFLKNYIFAGLLFIVLVAFIETNMSSICAIFSTSYFQKQSHIEYLGRFATVRFTLYDIAQPIGIGVFGLMLDQLPLVVSILCVVLGISLVAFIIGRVDASDVPVEKIVSSK